jgi:hypothetical protein
MRNCGSVLPCYVEYALKENVCGFCLVAYLEWEVFT